MFARTPTTLVCFPTARLAVATLVATGERAGQGYRNADTVQRTAATLSEGGISCPHVPAPPIPEVGRQEGPVMRLLMVPAVGPLAGVGFGAVGPDVGARIPATDFRNRSDCQSPGRGHATGKPDARGADPRWLHADNPAWLSPASTVR